MGPRRRRLPHPTLATVLWAAALAFPQAARPEDDTGALEVRVEVGVVPLQHPAWFPVWVEIRNAGREARLRLEASTRYFDREDSYTATRTLDLPASSTKRAWLYLAVDDRAANLRLRVWKEGEPGPLVERFESIPRLYSRSASSPYAVLVATPTPGAFDSLRSAHVRPSMDDSVNVIHDPSRLPDRWAGYDAVDLLILHDFPLDALSAAQLEAMALWVRRGGRLAACPGTPGWLSQDFFSRLAGVTGVDVLTVDARRVGLEAAGQTLRSVLPRLAAAGPLPGGLPSRFGSILRWTAAGRGRVVFLGLDPGVSGLRATQGMQALWGALVDLAGESLAGAGTPAGLAFPEHGTGVKWRSALLDTAMGQLLDAAGLPPVGLVFGLVALYVLLVGPLNYLVLDRLRRQSLVVVTVPVLALVFVGVIFVSGYALRGLAPRLRGATLLVAQEGSPEALGLGFHGVYSGLSGRHRIDTADRTVSLAPVHKNVQGLRSIDGGVDQGETWSVPCLRLGIWEQAFYRTESTVDLGGPVRLVPQAEGALRVENLTRYALRGFVTAGMQTWTLVVLPPGGVQDYPFRTTDPRGRRYLDDALSFGPPSSFEARSFEALGLGRVLDQPGRALVALVEGTEGGMRLDGRAPDPGACFLLVREAPR
ncbi:MAG: hypothetical protein HY722_16315 [Planctomycetes bacterium]|nr:hypothetical protein [Planctomycetota bacterium]